MQLPKAAILITLITLVSGIAAQNHDNVFDERDVDDVRLDARDLYIRDLESELAARDANEGYMKYLEQRVSNARTGLRPCTREKELGILGADSKNHL